MIPEAMRERLAARLAELKEEFGKGTEKLGQLDEETRVLRETLLRISGAIQVLTEELERDQPSEAADAP
ncbi:hypothetical protein RZN05_00180 [Sphingomonas sp. HF-S4]|uniref:Uncharacterized protein n=1 Tax=Sphingomonas agrestis TaxID=3080540 RepID=A0ABU3Y2R2_9SPHN|nr:hypothetical protein [Sphingomonas sp. HF-S4]MDV3455382.1 hypothetical protein [Sphingomonas sp. HF-S4]